MDSHIVNEKLNRLEPKSTKCVYCNNGIVTDVDRCHYLALYIENKRTNVIVYSSVKYLLL